MVTHQTTFAISGIQFNARWIYDPKTTEVESIVNLCMIGHAAHDITSILDDDVSIYDQFAGHLSQLSKRIIESQYHGD